MFNPRTTSLSVLCASLLAGGCGYSEAEMQAKIHDIDGLKTQLSAEQERSKKAKGEIDDQAAKIEQLTQKLRSAGVDVSNLNANLEQQARALEEYRRHAEQVDSARKRFEALRQKLTPLAKSGVAVAVRNNRIVVALPGDALFDAGRETLKKEGEGTLLKIAEAIRSDPGLSSRSFQIAAHTDGAPVTGVRFKDGLGLSAMRAREVLAFIAAPVAKGGGGLNPGRLSAAGYGDTDPVKPNESPEGKQANRRCELVMLPNADEVLDLKSLER